MLKALNYSSIAQPIKKGMHRNISILLIGHDPADRNLIVSMLGQTEYGTVKVIMKSSVPGHKNLVEDGMIAAILISTQGIHDKGLDTLRKAIACYPHSTVILLTAEIDDDISIKVLEEGGHYLKKESLNPRILSRAIRSWVDRNRTLSELQKAHESLKLSEQRFARLFNGNHLVGLALSTIEEGKFIQVNEVFLRFTGYSNEEVIGKSAKELGLWAGRDEFVSRLKNREVIRNQEIEVRGKNGNILHVLLSFDIIETDLGPAVLTVSQDLSGKFESFLKLRQSETNLDTLINSSSKPIWLVDRELRLVTGNQAFYQMLDRFGESVSPGDLIFNATMKEDVLQRWKAWYGRAMEAERFTVQNHGVGKDQEDVYNEVTFNPAYDHDGRLSGIGCFLHDVTDLKKTNERLMASESRYRSLVENASDAILTVNTDGDYVDVNAAACNLLGYTRTELLSMNADAILPDEEQVEAMKLRMELLLRERSVITRLKLKKKDGTLVAVESHAFRLPDGQFVGIVRDLTDRLKAQRAESELQKRLRAIFNETNDAILLTDDYGNFVQVNPAALKMFGYTSQEFAWETVAGIIASENAAGLWKEFLGEGQHKGTVDFSRKDRSVITCDYNARANILPGLHLFVLTDVTERKRSEDMIRESEARLAEAQKLAQCGNWDMDYRTGKLTWSEELYRIFDTGNVGFFNSYHSFMNLVDKADRDCIRQAVIESHETGNGLELEYQITTTGGEKRIIQTVGHLKRDPDGKIIGLFGTAQNITERKKAEEAVKESEKNYRYLFENNPLPMWVMDKSTLAFLDVNEGGLRHYQHNREEFLAMRYPELKSPEEKKRFSDFQYVISKEPLNTGIWKHRKKDGSEIEMEILFNNITFNHQDACLVIANDVTGKLSAEREIKESYRQLQELTGHLQHVREEERTRIAREVHDELGQQLTGLKMDASWIKKRMLVQEGPVQEKLQSMLSLIDETVRTVRRISSELRPGILDDLGLVPALEWYGKEFERRTGIESRFFTSVPDFQPDRNTATNIFRICQEALTNVARHSQATVIETALGETSDFITLTVKDNGNGFDLDEAKNKKSLGLVGMKERALLFSGKLTIETMKEKGTVITLVVPKIRNDYDKL